MRYVANRSAKTETDTVAANDWLCVGTWMVVHMEMC